MEKCSLKKFEQFELKGAGSIWGGTECNKWTQHTDYCQDANGNCTADETCWQCDDAVAAKGGAAVSSR